MTNDSPAQLLFFQSYFFLFEANSNPFYDFVIRFMWYDFLSIPWSNLPFQRVIHISEPPSPTNFASGNSDPEFVDFTSDVNSNAPRT